MPKQRVSILFSTSKKWNLFSAILKWYLKAPYSHVCLKIHSHFYERTMIYESCAGQVQTESYDNWIIKNKIVAQFDLEVSDQRRKEIVQFCIDHLRHKYCLYSLFKTVMRDKFGVHFQRKDPKCKKFNCSEFTFISLKNEILDVALGRGYVLEEEPECIDPAEVYQLLFCDYSAPKDILASSPKHA